MKKFKLLSVSFAFLLCFVFISGYASASTPSEGVKWSSSAITFYNDGSNSFYSGLWSTAESRWNNTSDVYMTTGSKYDFRAGNQNAGSVDWDGITNYSYSGGLFTKVRSWVNTYYTTQSSYTTSICNGIATHEFGHALGLAHNSSTSSVMYPYTFNSNGTVARTTTSPASADTTTLYNIYGVKWAVAKPISVPAPQVLTSSENYVVVDPSWAIGYTSIKDLASKADLIVEGTIGDKSELKKDANGDFFSYRTNRSILVSNVLRGDKSLENTPVTFDQLGGIDPNATVVSDKSTPLEKDNKVILFLKKNGGVYSLINENESIFTLDNKSADYKYLKDDSELSKKNLLAKIN